MVQDVVATATLMAMPGPDLEDDSRDENITELLRELSGCNADAEAQLIPLIYDELRRMAHAQMSRERPDHTLQTTALVHEAYLKLTGGKEIEFTDRGHFFAVASQVMRQILVDYARKRRSMKRGGESRRVELRDSLFMSDESLEQVLIVHQALNRLKSEDPRQAQVVVLRFFGGLDNAQVAEVLGVSEKTVVRDWKHAQAWLFGEIAG